MNIVEYYKWSGAGWLDFAILSSTYGHWVHTSENSIFNFLPSGVWLPITDRGKSEHLYIGGKIKNGVLFGWYLLIRDTPDIKKYKHSSTSIESMKYRIDKNWRVSNRLEVLLVTGSAFLELITDDYIS